LPFYLQFFLKVSCQSASTTTPSVSWSLTTMATSSGQVTTTANTRMSIEKDYFLNKINEE
jgi:hypothetical protein